ncbi:endonuclease/exonuclease/phosphatase family protein [Kitasatospora sp. NPDC127067]|uniref:endonuclease/exonuclease/phosphatase family protein n=1 Tax=Kitasatospora sp. NPDC127067 TaxID=3347126 RepID=UPI003647C661
MIRAIRARFPRAAVAATVTTGLLIAGLLWATPDSAPANTPVLARTVPPPTSPATPTTPMSAADEQATTAERGAGAGAGSPASPLVPVRQGAGAVTDRVMTWNLYAPGAGEPENYAAEIAKYRPQVLGVQEGCKHSVERTVKILADKYGLKYQVAYGTARHDPFNCGAFGENAYGQAILSAAPIAQAGNQLYTSGGSEDRAFMWVTTTVGGKQVRIYNTHLAEGRQSAVRAAQVRQLAATLAGKQRVIVLGDFNTQPDSPEMAPLWSVGLTDADPKCGWRSTAGCKPTADAGPPRKKFDYILLSGVKSTGATVVDSVHSDHDVVYAALSLS